MKKTLVAQTVAALIGGVMSVGVANAFVVGPPAAVAINGVPPATELVANSQGSGHILLVPYYSAQAGNDTYLNIVNTDMRNGKAVKVRFRGASNSDDVLDFTILLSPGDVWAGAVSRPDPSLPPKLTTSDKTCTLPSIPSGGAGFITSRLHPNLTAAEKAAEASEGYIEIFNMADIPPTVAATGTLYRDIEHVSGTPRARGATSCTSDRIVALNNAALTTNYATAIGTAVGELQLGVPTTGLVANWSIVNVPNATLWSGSAWAVEARDGAGVPGYGNIVFHPQTDVALGAAPFTIQRQRTADPLLRGGAASNDALQVPADPTLAGASYDLPDMSTPYLWADLANLANGVATKTQASRLTAALAAVSIANEYSTVSGLEGTTDWSFTMPTRRYNVARAYSTTPANESAGTTVFSNLDTTDAGVAIVGNNDYFVPTNVSTNTVVGKRHQLCVSGIELAGGAKGTAVATAIAGLTSPVTADREEGFQGGGSNEPVFSPQQPGEAFAFCGEASVLVFNATGDTSSLGSTVARIDLATTAPSGWVRLSTPGAGGLGLPVIGYNFLSLTNNNAAPGVKGTYGLAFQHRTR